MSTVFLYFVEFQKFLVHKFCNFIFEHIDAPFYHWYADKMGYWLDEKVSFEKWFDL